MRKRSANAANYQMGGVAAIGAKRARSIRTASDVLEPLYFFCEALHSVGHMHHLVWVEINILERQLWRLWRLWLESRDGRQPGGGRHCGARLSIVRAAHFTSARSANWLPITQLSTTIVSGQGMPKLAISSGISRLRL